MIVALYIIGSILAMLIMKVRINELREELRKVKAERDAYSKTIEVFVTPMAIEAPEKEPVR